jgi:Guanylate-binding protein, N-terminal domain
LKPFFPSFFWVMRDFYHDLEGRTPKQYLEDCLQEAPGFTADVLRKNKIRMAILKHFKERECFTMIRPVSEESKLAHVESLSWDDSSNGLKPEFKRQVTNFVNQVGKKLKPKVIQSKHLNASMLLTLALEYTEAINSKETPTVLTALDRVVQAETIKVIDCNLEAFKNEADQALSEDLMPMNERDLSKIVRKLVKKHQLELQRQLA